MLKESLVVLVVVYFAFSSRLFHPKFPVYKEGVVVVTGASTGIGHDAAVTLHDAGYTVFAGIRRKEDADSLQGERMHPIILDVTSSADIDRALVTVQGYLSTSQLPLAGVVNNAGIGYLSPFEFSDPQRIRALFDVNVFGLMDVTRAFLPLLRQSQGRVVNIGSIAGLFSAPLCSAYSATKFAVSAISDSLRRELHRHGVSVSEINPAFVKTPIQTKGDGIGHYTEEQLALYPLKEFEEKTKKSFPLADSTEVTSSAILDAITSESPRARYVVANVDGIPAWIIAKILTHLPVEVVDFMIQNL